MARGVCEKCGNEIFSGVRFCRKCGHPTGEIVTAAATQALGSTPSLGAPTTVLNPDQTRPTSKPPESKSVPVLAAQPVAERENVQPQRSKLPIVIAVLVVVLGAAVIYFVVIRGRTQNEGSHQTVDTNGSKPGSNGSSVGVSQNLIYPGSKPGMSVSRQNRTIAQYETSDPLGKVIDWYKYKMKLTDVRITPGGQQAVLTQDKSTVTLTSGGTVTNITITQER